mmetsp:Transcript_1760/g.6226  ORF Transcript_1760/g.6226 Transcript_1760/m.6226 type:complete len:82 (+) Transcript_1760:321-566(+)
MQEVRDLEITTERAKRCFEELKDQADTTQALGLLPKDRRIFGEAETDHMCFTHIPKAGGSNFVERVGSTLCVLIGSTGGPR